MADETKGGHKESSFQRIQSLQADIAKETDNLKVQLAKELDKACNTFKMLTELGIKDILSDPQYAEFTYTLGIKKEAPPVPAKAEKITVKEAILEVMRINRQTNVATIVSNVAQMKKVAVTTGLKAGVAQGIAQLKKAKKLKKVSRGIYQAV